MNNQNQFPKSDSDLPLNKPDGYKDTFTDESINKQSRTVQPLKTNKSAILRVKIIAGILIVLGLILMAQAIPILVSIVSGSSGLTLDKFRIVEVSAIFQLVIGILLLVTSVLLLRKSEVARKLVILTGISLIIAEIYLIFQGGSLFYWIGPLRIWSISLSLLFFLCIFLILSVTSKEIKVLFTKPQQMVTAKARPISDTSIPPETQVSMTSQKESNDSRILHNLKIIGFTGIVFGFIVLILFAFRLVFLFSLPPLKELKISLLHLATEWISLLTSICLFIAAIGLTRYKQWGRLMFKVAGIVLAVLIGIYVGYMLFLLPFTASSSLFFFHFLSLIIPFTLFLIGLILIISYLGKEKVKKVCS